MEATGDVEDSTLKNRKGEFPQVPAENKASFHITVLRHI